MNIQIFLRKREEIKNKLTEEQIKLIRKIENN